MPGSRIIRSRRLLANVTIAVVVGVGTAAGVAVAGGSGPAKPVKQPAPPGHPSPNDPVAVAARAALQRLVAQGTITQAQADGIQRLVVAGSIDPRAVVASGLLTDAQMRAVGNALDQVKRSLAGS